MGIVIGPVLRRADGYIFASWTASKGVIRGYPYRRIEDAHYEVVVPFCEEPPFARRAIMDQRQDAGAGRMRRDLIRVNVGLGAAVHRCHLVACALAAAAAMAAPARADDDRLRWTPFVRQPEPLLKV
jgi:hypothetical protein